MKTILTILLITGIAAIVLGFVLTIGGVAFYEVAQDNSMRVGSETCFHCHVAQHEDWSIMLSTRIIFNGNSYPLTSQSYTPPLTIEPITELDDPRPYGTLSPHREP